MDADLKTLRLRQTDAKLRDWRHLVKAGRPNQGWIRTIRQALGMTTSQLAARLDVSKQAVADLEQREVDGGVTLAALEKAASALDCDVVYAVVPRQTLATMLEAQARSHAERILGKVAHTMSLEAQRPAADEHSRQVDDMAADLVRSWARSIWDAPDADREREA